MLANYNVQDLSQTKLLSDYDLLLRNKESFKEIPEYGALLFKVAQTMTCLQTYYIVDWTIFLSLYDCCIEKSESSAQKNVCNEMVYYIYNQISQSLQEKDQILFALELALEMESKNDNVQFGEKEFLVSSDYCLSIIQAKNSSLDLSRMKISKLFDWMSDDQHKNLRTLGTCFSWFKSAFDKMSSKEAQWRNLCEGDKKVEIPDGASFTPIQVLLVMRSVRPDDLHHLISQFVSKVLGKKYDNQNSITSFPTINERSLKENTIARTILYFTDDDSRFLEVLSEFKEKTLTKSIFIIEINGNKEEYNIQKQILQNKIKEVDCVCIRNAHLNKKVFQMIMKFISEVKKKSFGIFYVFATYKVNNTYHENPLEMFNKFSKVCLNTPRMFKQTLLNAFKSNIFKSVFESLPSTKRPDWINLISCISILHASILQRCKLTHGFIEGVFLEKNITYEDLEQAMELARKNLPSSSSTVKSFKWPELRHKIVYDVYGKQFLNVLDESSLKSLTDKYLCQNPSKKENDFFKTKSIFSPKFSQYTKISYMLQEIQNIPKYILEKSEICGLHSSDDDKILTNFYTTSRYRSILEHTSETITPQKNLSFKSTTSVFSSTLQRDGLSLYLASELDANKTDNLLDTCSFCLSKTPQPWSLEAVNEKINRSKGNSNEFSDWLQLEINFFTELLVEIKRSTTCIFRTISSLENYGNQLQYCDVVTALELNNSRIPRVWLEKAGINSYPSISLSEWVHEVGSRYQHFERMINLGKERIASYWLGCYRYPATLISIMKQDTMRKLAVKLGHVCPIEKLHLKTEITQRDKDHLRDPPSEGFFIWGVYIQGCCWERSINEVSDQQSKLVNGTLPSTQIIHITFSAKNKSTSEQQSCPVFKSINQLEKVIFYLTIPRSEHLNFSLRGVKATLLPY